MTEELRGWLLDDEEIRRLNPAYGVVDKALVKAEAKHLMQWLDTAGLLRHRDRTTGFLGQQSCLVCKIVKELGL
mgnify:FL=1